MLTKTAGAFAPLLALGLAAVVGGCSTQEDAQPDQFNQPPVIEAVYARDSVAGLLPDVQVWANPADPHYPNFAGETGAQNAQNVSPFPASYASIVVEFNTPLDGSKLGAQNDFGSYCSVGQDPSTAPFKVVVGSGTNNERALLGSICYEPSSPLYRYPSITFVLGAGTANDPSAQPFTCQAFTPESWEAAAGQTDATTTTAFNPLTNYTIVFNTTALTNDNGQGLATPTGAGANGWTSGSYTFTTSGFEIMAAGFQDQSTGYYTFIDKPYAGFLKDKGCGTAMNPTGSCPAASGTYQQPSDDTLFFIVTTYGYNFIPPGAQGLAPGDCVPGGSGTPQQPGTSTAAAVTATRADGSHFDELILDDYCVGGLVSNDPRFIYVAPGYSIPGLDTPASGGGATWEPGQSYVITVNSSLSDITSTATLGTTATYSFTAAAGSLGPTAISPDVGAVAQLAYGKNGPAGATYYFGQGTALGPDQPSFIVANYNAPIDPTTATTTNFVVAGPDGTPVPGTVALAAATNNQAITFQPTTALSPATTYTVDIKGLTVTASIPTLGGQAFPELQSTFTTSTMRTSGLDRLCIDYPNNNECGGNLAPASADRASNQPLQILYSNSAVVGDNLILAFARPAVNVSSATVAVQQINADGTTGAAVDPSLVTVTPGQTSVEYTLSVDPSVPVKCNQKYEIIAATSITDNESPAVTLTAEGCKAAGGCVDIRSFTTQPYEPLPLDAAGDTILYTPTGQPDPTNPAATLASDQFLVQFNASLSAASVNTTLLGTPSTQNLIQVADSSGNPVQLTCPPLPDDNQYYIVCTAEPLVPNSQYIATMLVDSSKPLLIAQSTTLAPLYFDYQGQLDAASNTPTNTLVGDQTSCQYYGTQEVSFTTPCAQTTTRQTHKAHHSKKAAVGPLAQR